ncbi:MAG: metalloregulator ArsR/SmtB family transcription factor [Rhodobacterales bacterium]|nr:metalloregulator ArsR/SmtB family transcription factor [Rhodobacterales bacterium]
MDQSLALTALSALANETRLEIVRLLVPEGNCGLSAGEIATHVNATASRLSFHLNILEQAGLIGARREGRFQRYSVNHARLGGVIGYLLNDCCKAHPDICACTTVE